MVAAAVIGSAVVGGVASSMSAGKASKAQQAAAQGATDAQLKMYEQTREDLAPYVGAGTSATNALAALMGLGPGSAYAPGGAAMSVAEYDAQIAALRSELDAALKTQGETQTKPGRTGKMAGNTSNTSNILKQQQNDSLVKSLERRIAEAMQGRDEARLAAAAPQVSPLDSPLLKPFNMTQAELEKTPGYQFNLTQGLKSVQNAAAARGLGSSGAALKGAASYATGLADSTYQNQFNNYVTNQTNQFNRLMSLANQGAGAAAQTGQFGTQTAANIGNNLIGAGNAQAAAYMNMGNNIAGAANNIGGYYALRGIYG